MSAGETLFYPADQMSACFRPEIIVRKRAWLAYNSKEDTEPIQKGVALVGQSKKSKNCVRKIQPLAYITMEQANVAQISELIDLFMNRLTTRETICPAQKEQAAFDRITSDFRKAKRTIMPLDLCQLGYTLHETAKIIIAGTPNELIMVLDADHAREAGFAYLFNNKLKTGTVLPHPFSFYRLLVEA